LSVSLFGGCVFLFTSFFMLCDWLLFAVALVGVMRWNPTNL